MHPHVVIRIFPSHLWDKKIYVTSLSSFPIRIFPMHILSSAFFYPDFSIRTLLHLHCVIHIFPSAISSTFHRDPREYPGFSGL